VSFWTIIVGFIACVVAKSLTSGDNESSGFILTMLLGIVGAFSPPFPPHLYRRRRTANLRCQRSYLRVRMIV
jgi:hypothetical protein